MASHGFRVDDVSGNRQNTALENVWSGLPGSFPVAAVRISSNSGNNWGSL
jgi:hypothetical protein